MVCITPTSRNGGRYRRFRQQALNRELDSVKHGKPATAGFLAKPEGCVMCDRPQGAAGTPAHPAATVFCEGFCTSGDFSAAPTGYEQDTNRIRPPSTDVDPANFYLTAPFMYVCRD